MITAPDQVHRMENDAAGDQIALIAGSAETPIRIRTIHWDRSEEGRRKHPSHEYEGALASIAERTRKLNLDGYNVYIVAQPTKPLPADGCFTRDTDIIGVRCLYADGDNSKLPSEWHVEPTFNLVHPKTERWWAYWSVTNFPLDQLRNMIKRIALHYDGDIKISNPARIVRLAGYDRWKDGKNYGPYELQRRSGISTEQWRHQGLPPAPARKRYEGRADATDLIELDRLRKLLAFAPPFERSDWLKVMFAIRDGTVIDDKFAVLDEADKLALFDEWASDELYKKAASAKLPEYHVGNHGGYEDNEYHWNSPKSDTDEPVGFGSLIHLAKTNAANHDVPFPTELGRPGVREGLHKSGSKFEDHSAKPGASRLTELIADAPEADLSPDGWFEKCARMDPLEYEQRRPQIASDLNIRIGFLDKQVNHRRRDRDAEANNNDHKLVAGIENIEPWPEEVELKAVLGAAVEAISQYVHMPPTAIDAIILWAAHTHILDRISVSPRLAFQSPGPGCGKTVSMEATANLVPRPISAASITTASTFRIIEAAQPTLCIDEADQLFRGDKTDLVAVMNSSHRRASAYVLRTVEVAPGQHEAKQFSTWAPVMFAGIRTLPPTLQDRSIVVRLQRALPGEVRRHLRDGRSPILLECGRKLARWAQDLEELPDLALPPEFSNRVGDNWRPLFAIAKLAGGDWPDRVMVAARSSLRDAELYQGIAVILLRDIMSAFGERDRMASKEIVDSLLALDDGPYQEARRGRPITAYWLAQQLKGVISGAPGSIRIESRSMKGYYRHQFEEAWKRYAVD